MSTHPSYAVHGFLASTNPITKSCLRCGRLPSHQIHTAALTCSDCGAELRVPSSSGLCGFCLADAA